MKTFEEYFAQYRTYMPADKARESARMMVRHEQKLSNRKIRNQRGAKTHE